MNRLNVVLLLCGAISVLAGRDAGPGRNLLQAPAVCAAPQGCDKCPQGCATTAGSCVRIGTSGFFKCKQCAHPSRRPSADGSCAVAKPEHTDVLHAPNGKGVQLQRQAKCTPCPGGRKTKNGLDDNVLFPGNPTVPSVTPAYEVNYGSDGAGETTKTSAADCLVPPGFYATGGGSLTRCPKGEYRAGYVAVGPNSRKCFRCPRGTTTYASSSPSPAFCDQLLPGYYWVDPTKRIDFSDNTVINAATATAVCPTDSYWSCPEGTSTPPTCNNEVYQVAGGGFFSPRACCTQPGFGFDGVQAAPCAQGTYSAGDTTGAACVACTAGFTTTNLGSVGQVDCNGSQAGPRTGFSFFYNGQDNAVEVSTTSEPGAVSVQQCLLEFAPIQDANWFLAGVSTPAGATDPTACLNACKANLLCQFFTFNHANNQCALRLSSPGTATRKVAFKVLAGAGNRRRSLLATNSSTVKPKDVGSGVWSWWSDANTAPIGTPLTPTSGPTNSFTACLDACNDNPTCAAVIFVVDPLNNFSSCTFAKGEVTEPSGGSAQRSMIRFRTDTSDRPNITPL
ncbi:hypothetical protein COO60DRAFT_1463476 [Scenedesmus sp. NREL 46B-D3]|nr:hypothetical protein COO60DRAFT_1463476 [Scenedesmus sp. NREL 46B-D3]